MPSSRCFVANDWNVDSSEKLAMLDKAGKVPK